MAGNALHRLLTAVAEGLRRVTGQGQASRTLMSGWGKLAGTNAALGLLQLISFAIAARALDIAVLSAIVLIQTYVRVVDALFNFQSVNVLTRYLAEAEQHGDPEQLRGFVKAGLLVDSITAALATAIAIVALPVVAPAVGIGKEWIAPGMLFCLVILTRILGVSEAILRCFERFWSIGLRGTIQGLIVVLASVCAWWTGAGARIFLYIWLAAEAVANIAFVTWALVVARKHGIRGLRQSSATRAVRSAPQFWPMLWQTNGIFAIRMLSQEADVLVAGSVLGPVAAGLLRAIKNLAAVINQLGRPLQQVVSAPVARLVAARRYGETVRLVVGIGVAAGVPALIVVLGATVTGEHVLINLYGAEFASAKWALVALLFAASLFMFGVALLPLAIALDRARIAFRATVLGTIVYFALLALLTGPFGILGIAVAHIGFNTTWLLTSWILSKRALASANVQLTGLAATTADAD
jgi:O-antigen/teichoic acid export membrane protein